MAFFLAFKEVWRNKSRFFLFSMVIALITTLVLFVAALAQGLALANRQYLDKLDANLLVFQANTDLSTLSSRLDQVDLNRISRIEGVQAAGPIGFASASIVLNEASKDLNVSIIGVDPDLPGAPPVLSGVPLFSDRSKDVVIDSDIAKQAGLQVGETFQLKSIQGIDEKLYDLRVIGITSPQQNQYAPSMFVPIQTWDRIRPQASTPNEKAPINSNVIAVKLVDPAQQDLVAQQIENSVKDVEVADIRTAINALPGYSAQQGTLQTQQAFVLLIGILVIGGFFQIQMLQKIPLIGVLKAIGIANRSVAWAVIYQIILVSTFGVIFGGLVTLGLAAGIPDVVPIQFSGATVALAISALLLIGPLGGLVSVRLAVRVEPLIALGLNS